MYRSIVSFPRLFLSVTAFLCLCWPPESFSAEQDIVAEETSSDVEGTEIVVTATRYEEAVSRVPAHVTVITREDIQNSTAVNVADLLRPVQGVFVNDITGSRRIYSVDVRGFGESAPLNTLVLVDGRRINQPDLSGTDWAQIPLERIERIEIVRGGAGAVLYGDNASGGTVNIITREGKEPRADIGIGAGSYESRTASAGLSGRRGGLSYAFSGSYLNSEGYRDNSDTDLKDAGANLNYDLGDRLRLNLSGGYHWDRTGLPGAIPESDFAAGVARTDTVHPDDYARVEDYYVKGGPEVYLWSNGVLKIDGSYRRRDVRSFASFGGGDARGETEITTNSLSPQFVATYPLGRGSNTVTVGFDYYDAEEDIVNTLNFLGTTTRGSFNLDRENYGVYLHDELVPLEPLTVSVGYRYDNVEFDFSPSTPDHVEVDEDAYSAGINYRYRGKSYVYAGYSRSFRYPALDEFFSFFDNTINTGLVPQRSDSYEIGTRFFFSDDVYAHVNLFRIDTDDEIFFNPSGGLFGFGANENLDGEARRKGAEVSVRAAVLPWLTLGGGYTYTDSEIRGGQYDGKEVPGVPMHKASFNAEVSPLQGLSVAAMALYVGERPFVGDFSNSLGDQESFLIVNAKILYVWKSWSAYLDINNVTNTNYSEYGTVFGAQKAFYPSPERNFFAGLSVSL